MAKYYPIINKSKGVKMTLLEKIKCFFGFCEKSKKELEKVVMETYKTEPKVIIAEVKEKTVNKVIIPKKIKKRFDEENKKVKETLKESDIKATIADKDKIVETDVVKKVKRHLYNNRKTQKLIPEGEETKLPKTWEKGKLKKKDK
jgi:hypothetical protein